MEFRIADTFTDSLSKLTGDEQKATKIAALDLQLNPAHPSLQFHKLEKAKDKSFASIRVNRDIRIIVHRTDQSLLLCYVAHHDPAYQWAESRKLETHPKTGAAQLVVVRETVQEIFVPKYTEVERAKPLPFAHIPESELLAYGVPTAWVAEVKSADEDTILAIAAHLPAEAAEAVLDLATGVKPKSPVSLPSGADPFAHPDAQRRFRVMRNVDELERALDYPWEKWSVFLHPDQRAMVERDYAGPARVSGSAGTGKTIVALHRAAFLARKNPGTRVLLATFSEALANALSTKLRALINNEPRLAERIEVHSLDTVARHLYQLQVAVPKLASTDDIRSALTAAAAAAEGNKYSIPFLLSEYQQIVDEWQIETWEGYRDVARLGRRTRLPENQRRLLWNLFEQTSASLKSRSLVTQAAIFAHLTASLTKEAKSPFDFVIVDEAQDVNVPQLRFLAALAANRPNALFFSGDLGQRIFQQPFSWKALGVDVRGRSSTLKINYRTSHQIRTQADRLLGPQVSDVDGNVEERKGTISVFNGPPPLIQVAANQSAETETIKTWLAARVAEGTAPHEIGIFVRSTEQLPRAQAAAKAAGLSAKILDHHVVTSQGHVSIGTMHLAKGLEFRAVAVIACDDSVIPLQSRIESVTDESDLEEVYNTERHLLYVACTRARDHLLITATKPASEFLDDLAKPALRAKSSAM